MVREEITENSLLITMQGKGFTVTYPSGHVHTIPESLRDDMGGEVLAELVSMVSGFYVERLNK